MYKEFLPPLRFLGSAVLSLTMAANPDASLINDEGIPFDLRLVVPNPGGLYNAKAALGTGIFE
jgi:hypothetical protein